ncbi:MAG: ATP phosphoribosyltransferase [Ignavibacteriaceae bacterium]
MNGNLKLALQKSGRLTEKSLELLRLCGLDIESYSERLVIITRNFPLEILFLRDDDIPEYVKDGVADIGVVGENIIFEKQFPTVTLQKLGFGRCSLLIAYPDGKEILKPADLNGKTIATSHPVILNDYLKKNKLNSKVIQLSGSVEIAPSLGVADVVCDIVSTGNTLMMNKLKKSFKIFDSEAVLISAKQTLVDNEKNALLNDLLRRIRSVLKARSSKYLMMNAPKDSLEKITGIIPSLKSPTILPLADEKLVAVHAVIPADQFWYIVEDLRDAGASGILLLPIENMIL